MGNDHDIETEKKDGEKNIYESHQWEQPAGRDFDVKQPNRREKKNAFKKLVHLLNLSEMGSFN